MLNDTSARKNAFANGFSFQPVLHDWCNEGCGMCTKRKFFHSNYERDVALVIAFAHGAMGHRIDASWWTYEAISRSSQCSTTGVTKDVVCAILSVGWCI